LPLHERKNTKNIKNMERVQTGILRKDYFAILDSSITVSTKIAVGLQKVCLNYIKAKPEADNI
jgi:hypothetical protein